MNRFFALALLAAVCPPANPAQHRLKVHPNPSIAILAITQGADGFLWLAAPDGLYRFDGFHYSKIPEYPFQSARYIATTGDGALWIAGAEGLVKYRNGFRVIWTSRVGALASLGNRLIMASNDGAYDVSLDGSTSMNHRAGFSNDGWFVDSRRVAWRPCFLPDQPGRYCGYDSKLDSVTYPTLPRIPFAPFDQVAPDAQGRVWIADEERAQLAESSSVPLTRRLRQRAERPYPLHAGRNGQIWFAGEVIHGLSPAVELRDRKQKEQYVPTTVFEDRSGRVWAASLGEGLIEWTIDPGWEQWFPEDLGNVPAAQVVRTAKGEIVAATHDNLYRLDPVSRKWKPIAREQRRYASVLPLASGEFLASVRDVGVARLTGRGEIAELLSSPVGNADDHRLLLRDRNGAIRVANKIALMRLDGAAGSLRLSLEQMPMARPPHPELGHFQQVVDLELDPAGRSWAGYADGIAWRDEKGVWNRIETDQPVIDVRSFTVSGRDIWVAHRGQKQFSRLTQNGAKWTVTRFPPEAGYGPPDTHFVKHDSRGWIWRGSTDGVHISDGVHVAPEDWIHIGLSNGLATGSTDQYGFFEDPDGSVWIAGEDGISHLRPDPGWFQAPRDAPPPRVTKTGQTGNGVRIEMGSLDAPPFRDYPLRYRLRPGPDDWKLSKTGTLEFSGLAAGRYSLELGYTGNGPSATSVHEFRITGSAVTSLLWMLPPLGGLSLWALLSKRFPWHERIRFRFAKAWFVLRRRFSRRPGSSPGAVEPARDLRGETFLSRYRLERVIARSGFAAVYEGSDLSRPGARVAVKVLSARAGAEGWVRDRFAHEVAALQSVRHPGVVAVLDSWIGPGGEPCIAMPFLEGPTLRDALRGGPLVRARVARLARLLGEALAATHERGVVHRDLKPENIMLPTGPDGVEQPVIVDFGTSGIRASEQELAATSLLAGSFFYLAPERLSGQYSPATDVYALGVIVLEMLTGKRLAELNVMFSEAEFLPALTDALRSSAEPGLAEALARVLEPAYDPVPQHRPGSREWAHRVASLLHADTVSTG